MLVGMSETRVRLGAHVHGDPIAEAAARGVDLVQIFLGDPQSWKGPEVAYDGGAEGLRQAAADAGVAVVVHAPYVINVASTNNRVRMPSRKLLTQHLAAATEVGAIGLVVHGGHVTAKDDPATGADNWRKAIEAAELDASKTPVLIENTAGGDHAMARRLDAWGRLWEAVQAAEGGEHVGVCLDTCHAHAGGIDLAHAVEAMKGITGRIDLVHANDSRDDFDSGADRHANLGQGHADPDALAACIAAAGAPALLETPGDADQHREDLEWLRTRIAAG